MKEHHKSALLETLFILVLVIFPTLFGIMKIYFTTEKISAETLYKSGEFFLYAVSLLSSSFLVYNHFRIRKSDFNSVFSFLTIILILIFSYAYTALANTVMPDLERIKYTSIISFIISIPIFYYAQVVSNKNSPDIGAQRRTEQGVIENALS